MNESPPARWQWLAALPRDFRFAARALKRAPGFSLAVFGTLLVCIGPNTAIFSALYSLALRPLPFPDPGQLVVLSNVGTRRSVQSSVPQYRDFKAHADLFAGFAVIQHQNITLDAEETPIRVPNDWVSADFFDVLGVTPLHGRFFLPEEETPGRDAVLVLAYDFWVSHYNADTSVVGRVIHAGDREFTVVGVAPPSLGVLSKPTCFFQAYAPNPHRLNPQARFAGDCILYARLKPGVALSAGLAQLTTLEHRFRENEAGPEMRALLESEGARIAATPLRPGDARDGLKPLWLLQLGALLVLLIGGVNVVNLFLARMNAKRTELAIRVALGASRFTILRQVLAESMLLTAAAAVAGLGVALLLIRTINAYVPIMLRMAPPVTLQLPVIGAILVVALLLALGVGLLPHLLLWRKGLRLGDARGATSSGGARTASGVLVMMQVAVAVILLVGAGLLLRSFAKVMAVDPGFDASRIVQGRIALPPRHTSDRAANLALQRRIVTALQEIPGVEHVAQVSNFGLLPNAPAGAFSLRDEPLTTGQNPPLASFFPVSADYFATMGMRVLEGRAFTDADDFSREPVVIVDESFVTRYSAGRQTVGRELSPGDGSRPSDYVWPRIIGVVNRANLAGLEQRDSLPFIFVPMNGWTSGGFNVLVRSPRPVADILRDIRIKLRDIDPALPLYATGSLQEGIDQLLMPRRGMMLLLGLFAGLALLLAAIGLYGVLAYDVTQRTREIGIRGALGAARAQIVGLILRQSLWKTASGLGLGLLGAFFVTRSMRSLLFDVAPADPISYVAVCGVLLLVAALASWLPAQRAAKVDPIIALRAE